MEIKELRNTLITAMRAKNPLAVIETFEETRAIALIKEIADNEKVNRKVYVWTCTAGFIEVGSDSEGEQSDPFMALCQIEGEKTNGKGLIYIMLDFHKFIDSPDHPEIPRKIRDLSSSLMNTKKSVIFVSPQFPIPGDLSKSMSVFDLPLPDRDEIEARITYTLKGVTDQITDNRSALKAETEQSIKKQITDRIAELVKVEHDLFKQWSENKSALIDACLGLTDNEIENLISRCIIERDLNLSAILAEKKQIIKKSGILEYFDTTETMSAIGGMDNAKRYMDRCSKMYSKEAREYGLKPPRGVLAIGLPGTGKSLLSKATSNAMKKPLLLLNMAAGRSKYVGETGQNMIKALKVAHAIAPAILWIDEIDKAVSRGSGNDMHQEDSSALGSLLTDMEEKPGLFYIATCNNPLNLPPELVSRFQKIFYMDLPTEKERSEIFKIQIEAIARDPNQFDLNVLAEKTPGYSGREIRNIVQESLAIAFDMGTQPNTEIVLSVISRVTPISIQKKADLERILNSDIVKTAEHAGDQPEKTPGKIGETLRKLEI